MNRHSHRDWTFTPEMYRQSIPNVSITLTLPIDRPPEMMFASAVPPLLCLFLCWVVSRWRIQDPAAPLFCLSCILHSIWGLDVIPAWGGTFVFALHSAAWLFVGPLQIDLAIVFASSAFASQALLRSWRVARAGLYGAFFAITPVWLFFNLGSVNQIFNHVKQEPYLIPLLALGGFAGMLSFPLCSTLSGYLFWQTKLALDALSAVDHTGPVAGCDWKDAVLRKGPIGTTELSHARQQIRTITVGASLSAIFFIVWLVIVVPVVAPRFGASSDWVVRIIVVLFFMSMALAMIRHTLWGIAQSLLAASLWAVIVPLMPAVFSQIKGLVQGPASQTLGIVVIVFLAWVPTSKLVTPLYRFLWRKKWKWQKSLDNADMTGQRPDTLPEVVGAACRERVSAAWLLVNLDSSQAKDFDLIPIRHSATCRNECKYRFCEVMNGEPTATGIRLDADLSAWLLSRVDRPADRVISLRTIISRREWIDRLPLWLKRTKRCTTPRIETSFLERLVAGRIALLLRFGGGSNLFALLVIATDRDGDYYDGLDLTALAQYAKTVSHYYHPALTPP